MIEGKESGTMPHGNSGQWEKYTLDKFKKMWGKVAEGRSWIFEKDRQWQEGEKTKRNRRQEWKKKKENSKGAGSASLLSQPVSDLPEHWSLWLCLSPSLQHSITWHPGPFYSPAVTHKQTLDEESRKAKKRGECLHFTLEVSRDQLKQQQTLCKMQKLAQLTDNRIGVAKVRFKDI